MIALLLLFAPWHRGSRWIYVTGLGVGAGIWIGLAVWLGIAGPMLEATLLFHLHNPNIASYFKLADPAAIPALVLWLCIMILATRVAHENKQTWVAVWMLLAALSFFARMDAFRLWPSTLMGMTYLFFAPPRQYGRLAMSSMAAAALVILFLARLPPGFGSEEAISQRVARLSSVTDPIWVGPFKPDIYCISHRIPASRYYFMLPWIATSGAKAELASDLYHRPPRVIVDVSNETFSLAQIAPQIRDLINARYTLDSSIDGARIYLLREPSQIPTSGTTQP
jgi:hypothetical protein